MTVLRNLYRQFPEKNGSPASFSRIEKILQNQLGLTKVVFALRYDKALKTIDGKNPFSAPLQKKVFVHFNQTLKPWILQKNDDLGWLGFWPVTTSKHWVGCFAMGRKRHPGELSGEEKILIELLADRTAFYLDKGRLWEILEKADRQSSLGFMSAAMIHEMRCPLTVLSTLVQLMAEKKDTRFISSIQPLMLQQINRLSGMTDHFLSFTHLEPKKTTRIEFSQVMNQVVRLLRPLFEVKRVQLKVKSSSGLFLKGNEPQLESLLLNLLQNALESSRPQGKIEISTALIFRRIHGPGPWIELKVKDNGRGISKESLKKIFDPYFSTRERGTGLGLAICQRVVENHQGTINASSSNGGTVFQIFLPAERKF